MLSLPSTRRDFGGYNLLRPRVSFKHRFHSLLFVLEIRGPCDIRNANSLTSLHFTLPTVPLLKLEGCDSLAYPIQGNVRHWLESIYLEACEKDDARKAEHRFVDLDINQCTVEPTYLV